MKGLRPEITELIYNRIGKVAAHWAVAEMAMDHCIAIIWHHVKDGKTISPELPVSLAPKCDFLKKAFRRLPDLAPFTDEAIALVLRVTGNKEERHDRIHGQIVTAMLGKDSLPSKFQFLRIQYEPETHVTTSTWVSTAKLDDQGNDAQKLGEDWTELAMRLSAKFPPT